jgi:hypothetical protein
MNVGGGRGQTAPNRTRPGRWERRSVWCGRPQCARPGLRAESPSSPNRSMQISVIDGLNLSFLLLLSALAIYSTTPYARQLAIVYPALLVWLLLSFRWHHRSLAGP